MQIKRISGPALEPVTLTEAKEHLRVLHNTEDVLIGRAIKAAREHVEGETGRSLITQTWKQWLPAFPRAGVIELLKPPLQSVTAIRYLDAAGVQQTLATSVYSVQPAGLLGWVQRRAGQAWPVTAADPSAVEIEFVAGYGANPADVPESIRNAVLLLVEHMYHNRGETVDGPITVNPLASQRLLATFRTSGWI